MPRLAPAERSAVCDSCNDAFPEDSRIRVLNGWNRHNERYYRRWCVGCAEVHADTCDHCSTYVHRSYLINLEDGCTTCEACDGDHHRYCDSCCMTYCADQGSDHDDCVYDDEDDYDSDYDSGELHSYSYTPRLHFRGDGARHLGMELEVSAAIGAARRIHENWGDLLYCKQDGSVQGFEMVTHPMTYGWAMESFPWDVLKLIGEHGTAGPNGLHVHISRAAFHNEAHVNAFLHLFYTNDDMVTAMARRDPHRWAKFEMQPFYDDLHQKAHHRQGRMSERYAAVNTTNEETLEVRVFASTLVEQEVKAALGLVDAACVYTAEHQDLAHLDWEHFSAWVFKHGGYPDLAAELHKQCVPVMEARKTVPTDREGERRKARFRDARRREGWVLQQAITDEITARRNELPLDRFDAEYYADCNQYVREARTECQCRRCESIRLWQQLGIDGYIEMYDARWTEYRAYHEARMVEYYAIGDAIERELGMEG